VDQLSALVGTKFDVLVGCDALRHYLVSISFANKRLVLAALPPSKEEEDEDEKDQQEKTESIVDTEHGDVVPLMGVRTALYIQFRVAGEEEWTPAFIDTGAKVSYIVSRLAAKFPALDHKREDFFPGVGRWETELHRIPITVKKSAMSDKEEAGESITFNVDFGVLPEHLEEGLLGEAAVAKGVLGSDLFKSFEWVSFDLQHQRLYLKNQLSPPTSHVAICEQ